MKKNMLNSDIAISSDTMSAPRSVRRRKIENGTSGSRLRSSIATNVASSSSDTAPSTSVLVDVQPELFASTSV